MAANLDISPALDSTGSAQRSWQALRYFNMYRIIVSGLFAVLGLFGKLPPNFTEFDVRQFTIAACTYLVLAGISQIAIEWRWFALRHQVNALVLVDIVAITVFIHASGGVAGGFGILLVVAIAGACLLSSGRGPIFFAALASIAVLAETVIGTLYFDYTSASYTGAGLLGAGLFVTALLASLLADQARRSEALAAERAIDIARLSRLNEHIVQRMRSGILVLDGEDRIVLINEAAMTMLDVTADVRLQHVAGVSGILARAYHAWLTDQINSKAPLEFGDQSLELIVSFTHLGSGEYGGTLVFLEDTAEMRQRAQQLKLASLGRLTANIAHEIRNPLGAISHAGQLLSESPAISKEDGRLTQIIAEHSARMNNIIESVMMIGRRESAIAESFDLQPWFEQFLAELKERGGFEDRAFVCRWRDGDIIVRMDQSQLRQVMLNLCENGLRYSTREPLLSFEFGVVEGSDRPYVDICDTGPGIDDDVAEQVFDPFYTGESNGTGLGLYIARELCEANQASLLLLEHGPQGCRFRINFAHPDRQQLTA
jgi:two-component system sensor histidine kinase PilS (NtrC family)